MDLSTRRTCLRPTNRLNVPRSSKDRELLTRHELLLLLGIVVSAGHLVCSLFSIVGEEVVNGNFKEPNNNRRQNEKEKQLSITKKKGG